MDFNPNANSVTQSTCTFSGAYTQAGKLGSDRQRHLELLVTQRPTGTFTMTQIEANTNGLSAKFHGTDQFCTYDGQFGGLLDVPMQ